MYTRDCIEPNNQTPDQAAAHYCLKAWVVPSEVPPSLLSNIEDWLGGDHDHDDVDERVCIVVVVDTMCSLPFSLKAFCQPWPSP